jgi:hypothetical protein
VSNSKKVAASVLDLLNTELPKVPKNDVADFVEITACACIGMMRAMNGDDYVRGFLDGAIKDLDKPSDTYVMPSAH